jgi:hypothetical protein
MIKNAAKLLGLFFAAVLFFPHPFARGHLAAFDFFDLFSLSFGGTILIQPVDDGVLSDPAPIMASPSIALAMPLFFFGNTSLAPTFTLDVYSTHYLWSDTLNRAVPAAVENRRSFVLGPLIGLGVEGKSNFFNFLSLRYTAGLTADVRFALIAEDLNSSELLQAEMDTTLTNDYFSTRWFNLFFGVGFDFKVYEKLTGGLDFRLWFPAWKGPEDAALPAIDGWRFGIGLRLTIPKNSRPKD